MTEREELLRRLERVKALAERGVGGEKETQGHQTERSSGSRL